MADVLHVAAPRELTFVALATGVPHGRPTGAVLVPRSCEVNACRFRPGPLGHSKTGSSHGPFGSAAIDCVRVRPSQIDQVPVSPGSSQVLHRDQILSNVWGYDFYGDDNVIEVYVGYLRRKTEAGGKARLIHTVRGVGYVLREK